MQRCARSPRCVIEARRRSPRSAPLAAARAAAPRRPDGIRDASIRVGCEVQPTGEIVMTRIAPKLLTALFVLGCGSGAMADSTGGYQTTPTQSVGTGDQNQPAQGGYPSQS